MPKTKISEFSATPANNTDIDSINIAEGCAPSGINDAIRELMAQLKDFQTGAVGDSFNGPVGTSTAAAGAFTTLAASGSVTLSGGTASGVTYLNGSKVLTSGSALTFDGTNLGVGTASPAAKLHVAVAGVSQVRVQDTANSVTTALTAYSTAAYLSTYTNHPIAFEVNNTEGMRLTSTGLGIGTSSPANPTGGKGFEISNASGASVRITNSTTYLDLQSGTNANYILSNGANPLLFYTNGSERARITSAGLFGVGTSSPDSTITAQDANASIKAISTQSGSPALRMYAGAVCILETTTNNDLIFRINSSEKARIDTSGNLLVGTTSFTSSTSVTNGIFGGNFRSIRSNATIPASSTGTVITLSSSVTGVYIVNANFGAQGNNIYGGMLIVVANAGSFRIVTNGGGSSSALSMSGANVQITNSLGSPLDAVASAVFIGN